MLADRGWVGGLRERLEDAVAANPAGIAGAGETPVVLETSPAPLDVLVGVVFRQWLVTGQVSDPWAEGLTALGALGRSGLVERLLQQTGRRAARTRAELGRASQALAGLERLDPRWLGCPGERISAALGGGLVQVVAEVDLGVGPAPIQRASRCLVQVTAGGSPLRLARGLRRAALVEALRNGVPPFQVVGLALGSSRAALWPVQRGLLEQALSELVAELGAALSRRRAGGSSRPQKMPTGVAA